MSCDFSVAVRILDLDSEAEVLDFNDEAIGLDVEQLVEPEESWATRRTNPDNVDGSFAYTRKASSGTLVLSVHAHGDTWAECQAAWEAARAGYGAADYFYLQTEIEGVSKTWLAERPDVTPEAITSGALAAKWLTYVLRFPVQPNPTVSIAGES